MLSLLAATAALRLDPTTRPSTINRRSAVLQTFAAAAVAQPALVWAVDEGATLTSKQKRKAELAEALAQRKAEERVAALPLSKLKTARDKLAEAPTLIDTRQWSELRARVDGRTLNELVNKAAYRKEVATLKTKLVKQLAAIDEFAYRQEKDDFMPGILQDYCAPGVVPRDEPGACKVRKVANREDQTVKIKEAVATLDAIINACS